MTWIAAFPNNIPLELEVSEHYLEDPRGKVKSHILGLAKPSNIDDLQALIQFARKTGVPLVPYGGGTGLVAGQLYPDPAGAILVSFQGFRDIVLEGDTVVVGAGVALDALQETLRPHGLRVPISLASSGSAQIGGLLNTNAGGVETIRFGNMRAQMRGVLAVAGDGTVIDKLAAVRKDNTGYDLSNLIVGSEGTLALLAKARLRTVPRDKTNMTVLMNLPALSEALPLLERLRKAFPDELAAFELLSGVGLAFRRETGFTPDYPMALPEWAVLFELASPHERSDELFSALETCLADIAFEDAVFAKNEKERQALWQIRETLPLANRKIGAIASHDISIPENSIESFIEEMPARLLEIAPDIRIHAFGHLGDGNLHYNLFPGLGKTREDYAKTAAALSDEIYHQVRRVSGSISAEHGIGRLKAESLVAYGYGEALHLMRAIKAAFDPNNILNPGVIFPMHKP